MAMTGIGNLTPQEAAERCERWFGAYVDYRTAGKIKIYPKDKSQPVIVISDRWHGGNDRRNAVSRLQRAGLDVVNGQTPPDSVVRSDGRSVDPHLTQKIEIPDREDEPVTSMNGTATPAEMPSKLGQKVTPTPIPSHADHETVLGMLAEAEQRDQARQAEIAELTRKLAALSERVELGLAQNRMTVARAVKAIHDAERRLLTTGAIAEDPAVRAERERAELTDKAVALLESLPPAATMSAGSLAASLGMPEKGNLLGKLMAVAEKNQRVTGIKVGAQKLYRAVRKEES